MRTLRSCYHRHQHQSRGRLGAWVSRGNQPQKVTLGSVSMYPLVLLIGLVAVTVCRPLPLSPLPNDDVCLRMHVLDAGIPACMTHCMSKGDVIMMSS
jgi:hypothetical protein